MSDDQGSIDAGCYGATVIKTAATDALANQGVRFTQYYSAAPVCSPSRAGLLTGCYPWRVGMPGNGSGPPSEEHDNLATYTGSGLPVGGFTMPGMFQKAGYATAHIGKWHLGVGVGCQPLQQGFDYSFGFMGGCIDNYSHFNYWGGPNRHDLWENGERVHRPGEFFPDLMVEKAESFIDSHRDKPFFMYFAINVPHYPYQGDSKWIEYYNERQVPYPRNLYAAWVSTLDDRLAQLMKYLDDTGLRENTIVVYQADNGYSTEQRAHHGGGSSGKYRGAKFSIYEGGTRLPAIISWPGHLPAGEVRSQVAHGCDWLPTLAEICDVPVDSQAKLNGRSLLKVIQSADASTPHDAVCWQFQQQWAVRQGPWKLMRDPQTHDGTTAPALVDGHWFLANIDDDPSESTNLASSHPELVEKLKQVYQREAAQ
ncbi:sulfatase-like hydrolase/transferase [Aeoliella mucimassa]|nr:sulfatase-like hydrolase/transferase [Aeoliella mucimassa]